MKRHQKEIIREVTIELLKSIFDLATPFFEASSIYRKSTRAYLRERSSEKIRFQKRIHYLKQRGLIDIFVEGKEKYYEITPKGKKALQKYSFKNLKIIHTGEWDKKWRLVIFDVPEKLRGSRDVLRGKLRQLGFYQIQKSVYVYPFECTEEIVFLSEQLWIARYVVVMISEIIQGEDIIVKDFLDRKILSASDLKHNRSDNKLT